MALKERMLTRRLNDRLDTMVSAPDTPPGGGLRLFTIVAIAAIAVFGAVALRDTLSFDALRDNRQVLLALRDDHLVFMALSFVVAYVAIVALSLPGATVASVAGGFLFGWAMGTALNVVSATLGASLLFLAVRWGFGRALTERIDASDSRTSALRQSLRENEISVMFMLRLAPVVPFFVANLLPALVGARFGAFVLTTALGIIPGALVFTWIGVGLGEVFDRGEDPDLSLVWEPYILGPLLALAALSALPIVVRMIRKRRT